MKAKRKIIEIDEGLCNGCGQCVSACAEGAMELVNGKAKLISENYCDGLAACIGECPEGALKIVEREAEVFDSEAVEHHLKETGKSEVGSRKSEVGNQKSEDPSLVPRPSSFGSNSELETLKTQNSKLKTDVLPCGCPSTHMQTFASPCAAANRPSTLSGTASALIHWPVQIKLIPPTAPFLKNADILVAADCTPVAYPDFHSDFLKGKAVLIGCPKFDDTEEYINKFAEIFKHSGIRSVTVLIMEVPCCSKLPAIVRQGMSLSGGKIPMEVVVISARGKVLRKEKIA